MRIEFVRHSYRFERVCTEYGFSTSLTNGSVACVLNTWSTMLISEMNRSQTAYCCEHSLEWVKFFSCGCWLFIFSILSLISAASRISCVSVSPSSDIAEQGAWSESNRVMVTLGVATLVLYVFNVEFKELSHYSIHNKTWKYSVDLWANPSNQMALKLGHGTRHFSIMHII